MAAVPGAVPAAARGRASPRASPRASIASRAASRPTASALAPDRGPDAFARPGERARRPRAARWPGAGATPRSLVRLDAWLGDWMRDNLAKGDDKKDAERKKRSAREKSDAAGLDPDLFAGAERVATAPSKPRGDRDRDRRGSGARGSSRAGPGPGRRATAPSPRRRPPAPGAPGTAPFDQLTPEELRPDFGLRRDLYDLYEVKSLDDEEPIGAGSYGIVRKVTRRADGKKFALKTIRKAPWRQPPTSRTSVQYYHSKLRNELEVMRTIGSSLSIVYLYDSFEDNDAVHLLMDLCEGGELLGAIRKGATYTEADAAELVRSVIRTAAQCHSRGIIFRDIKPDNFLFERDEPGSPLKATDFGLAGLITPGERLQRRCGTPSYMAPEVINRNYGEEADVWSCGVVAYQLLTGRLPFVDRVNQRPNAKEVFRSILEDPIDFESDPWGSLSEDCLDLVKKLLERDPRKRITARAALLHPWLQQTARTAEQPIGGQVVARLQRFSTYGLLKRSVLRLLGDQLRESSASEDGVAREERELTSEFLQLFDLLDTSGDELVEPQELEAGLRKVGYSISTDECKQLLEQLDTTNDGFIDVNEFLAALVDWEALEQSSAAYPNWVAQAFAMLDEDGNGTIDAEEVASLVFMNEDEGAMSAEAKKVVASCIKEADTDGDGLIDFEEFVNLLQMDPTDQLDAYEWRVQKPKEGGEQETSGVEDEKEEAGVPSA